MIRTLRHVPYQSSTATFGGRNKVQGNADAPLDMTSLRELAATQRPPRQQPRTLDINSIPFGVEIEMEGVNAAYIQNIPNQLQAWNVNAKFPRWKVTNDQSLSNGGAEAVSPVMTLGSGEARRQIQYVMDQMHAQGGRTDSYCGLHIHVDASVLGGDKGLANLMKIILENEPLLFRLSQNGHPVHRGLIPNAGYRHGEYHYYGKPLTNSLPDPFGVIHANNPDEFRNNIYGAIPPRDRPRPALGPGFRPDHRDSVRYHGVNFNAYWYQGTIEFRLFDGTDDPDQVMENIELVLSMVKAAAEDNYDFLRPNPVGQAGQAPTSRESFDYFMNHVASTPQLRDRLRRTFEASGGQIVNDPPVTDPTVVHVASLMREGYRFSAEGKPLSSPLEIAGQIGRRQLTVTHDDLPAPVGVSRANDLQKLYVAENRERLEKAADSLRAQGLNLVRTDDPNAQMDSRETMRQLLAGRLQITSQDGRPPVAAPDLDFVERYAALQDRETYRHMTELADQGWVFSREGQGAPPNRSAAFVALASNLDDLTVTAPGSKGPAPLRTPVLMDKFIKLECGMEDQADDRAKEALRLTDELKARGFKFFNKKTEDEIKTRSGIPLTLATKGHNLTMRDPQGHRRTRVSLSGLRNVLALETGHKDQMDAPLSKAVDNATALLTHGIKVQMKDITKDDDSLIDCSLAELVASLDGERRISFTDPSGQLQTANNADEFNQLASDCLGVLGGVDERQTQLLNRFQDLLREQHVVAHTQSSTDKSGKDQPARDVQQAQELPWLFHRKEAVVVNTPAQWQHAGAADRWGVKIDGWDSLGRFVENEARQPGAAAGETEEAKIIDQANALKQRGLRFYFVQPAPGTGRNMFGRQKTGDDMAVTLNTAFVERLKGEGVKSTLPKWTIWGGFPHKNITIKGADELLKLHDKFAK